MIPSHSLSIIKKTFLVRFHKLFEFVFYFQSCTCDCLAVGFCKKKKKKNAFFSFCAVFYIYRRLLDRSNTIVCLGHIFRIKIEFDINWYLPNLSFLIKTSLADLSLRNRTVAAPVEHHRRICSVVGSLCLITTRNVFVNIIF